MNERASTNYFDINLKKCVKVWLFGVGLNNGLGPGAWGLGPGAPTPPPYVKHPLMLNTGYYVKHGVLC